MGSSREIGFQYVDYGSYLNLLNFVALCVGVGGLRLGGCLIANGDFSLRGRGLGVSGAGREGAARGGRRGWVDIAFFEKRRAARR